jgi:hypothetical protein
MANVSPVPATSTARFPTTKVHGQNRGAARVRRLFILVATLVTAGCREAVLPFGSTLDQAKRNADNAFAAFAFRFYNVTRDPKFAAARPRMARFALIPSKIFGDTSIWNVDSPSDSSRALVLHGTFDGGRYLISARPSVPSPERIGDQRHVLRLRSLGQNNYEWHTVVEHGIGPVRATQVGDALGTLFTAFEGKREAELLADARSTFPRSAAHLGQLFRLDSLRSTPLPDGTTTLAMFFAVTPSVLRARYPAYAEYLQKYVMPSIGRLRLSDRQGVTFVDISARDGRFVVRLRARGSALVPLTGAPRAMPDSLQIRIDASSKFGLFRIAFNNLLGDFIIERGEHVRAWHARFRREPEWHFPFAVDKLIKTPLRRPFAGEGSVLWIGVRDRAGSQALSVREVRTFVSESAIMRWLGGLGANAFGDFSGRSELEENQYLTELFRMLRQDVGALGAGENGREDREARR